MIANRSEIARLQSDFYRDQFRKVIRWIMVSMVLMLLLIVAIIYCILVQPAQEYYANTSEGRIIQMTQEA